MDLPLFMTAEAILMPGHGDPTVEFDPEATSGPTSLKAMRPKQETVRNAVAEFKQLGFDIPYIGSFSLVVQAIPALFEAIFEVSLAFESENGLPPAITIQDSGNKRLFMFPLLQNDVLNRCVKALIPSRPTFIQNSPLPPLPPKKQSWHAYPHEIRERLTDKLQATGNPPQLEVLQGKKEVVARTNKWTGKDVEIAILDTGVNLKHPYLQQQLKDGPSAQITPIPAEDSEKVNSIVDNILKQYSEEFEELNKALELLKQFADSQSKKEDKKKAQEDVSWYLFRARVIAGDHKDKLSSKHNELREYFDSDDNFPKKTNKKRIKEYISKIKELVLLLTAFQEEVTSWRDKIRNREDLHGHGTGMASSALSVAWQASIQSWQTHLTAANIPLDDSQRMPLRLASFRAMIKIAHGNKSQKTAIASNSYASSFIIANPTHADTEYINSITKPISDYIKKGLVVLFCASNVDLPTEKGEGSREAFAAARAGAITVGGAYWDEKAELKASDTACGGKFNFQGHQVDIPTVCGLVGPRISELNAAGKRSYSSPYVYLPGLGESWTEFGGGTSSATAQIAGVCALLLEVWPNAGVDEVTEILVSTATNVKEGETGNGFAAKKVFGLRLANVPLAVTVAGLAAKDGDQKLKEEHFDEARQKLEL